MPIAPTLIGISERSATATCNGSFREKKGSGNFRSRRRLSGYESTGGFVSRVPQRASTRCLFLRHLGKTATAERPRITYRRIRSSEGVCGMDESQRRRLKAEARVELTATIVGHIEFRRGHARAAGVHHAIWALDRWLQLFEGYLAEERSSAPAAE